MLTAEQKSQASCFLPHSPHAPITKVAPLHAFWTPTFSSRMQTAAVTSVTRTASTHTYPFPCEPLVIPCRIKSAHWSLVSWSFPSLVNPPFLGSWFLANPSLPTPTLPRPFPCFKALTQPPQHKCQTASHGNWDMLSGPCQSPVSLATTPFPPHTIYPSNSRVLHTQAILEYPEPPCCLILQLYTHPSLCPEHPPPFIYLANS